MYNADKRDGVFIIARGSVRKDNNNLGSFIQANIYNIKDCAKTLFFNISFHDNNPNLTNNSLATNNNLLLKWNNFTDSLNLINFYNSLNEQNMKILPRRFFKLM